MKHARNLLALIVLALMLASPAPVLVQPEAGRAPFLSLLDKARTRIFLVAYRLTDSEVVAALTRARHRGVEVRVLLQQGADNVESEKALAAAGVKTAWGNPAYPLTHEKAVVIDQAAWVMTHNLSPKAFAENRGFALQLTDRTAVAEIVEVMGADWERRTVTVHHPDLFWVPGNDAHLRIEALINRSVSSLDITNEHMDDPRLERDLVEAAKNGVRVRVLMSSLGNDRNDRGRQRLREGGVQVRLLAHPFVHSKVLITDGKAALLGSINFSRASLEANRELAALTRERKVLDVLQQTFERDWAAAKTPAEVRKIPRKRRA